MIQALMGLPKLCYDTYTHLTTYLASGRAAKIDNCDTTVSSRAPSSTALSNATWTDTRAAKLDLITSGSVIKSIQAMFVSGTMYTGSGTDAKYVDMTISSVSTSKTVILLQQGLSGYNLGYGGSITMVGARLLNSTTVRISTSDSSATTIGAYFYVVEFN